jgi:Domain of unknown function (DUF1877)
MSQSTTIYNISKELFAELKNTENRNEIKIFNRTENSYCFQNSFAAIEFVLLKNKSEKNQKILNEIFNPTEYLGDFDFDKVNFENMDYVEEMFDFMESGNYYPFLNYEKVSEISKIISEITESEINENYSATELNENDIYPSNWSDENISGESNNANHLIEDFIELRKIIIQANNEENYLLICSG